MRCWGPSSRIPRSSPTRLIRLCPLARAILLTSPARRSRSSPARAGSRSIWVRARSPAIRVRAKSPAIPVRASGRAIRVRAKSPAIPVRASSPAIPVRASSPLSRFGRAAPLSRFGGAARYPGHGSYPGEQGYSGPPSNSYDPPGSGRSAGYAGRPGYETPPSYDAPPTYGTPGPYDAAPSYNAAPTYGTEPTYDAPPAPGPFGYEPSYPSQSPFAPLPSREPEPPPKPELHYRGAPLDGRAPHVSIVLPCYNEQDHVLLELERISRAMDISGLPYELIAVDDASTDGTLERLQSAEPKLPRLRVVHFPRNGGAGTVRQIGTQQAKGEIVVWTDADMTYPNERIPELVAMLDADPAIDQVVGARTSEEGTHKVARVPAKWFIRKLAEKLTNSEIPDLNSGLRAFRREVAQPYLRLLPPGFSCVTTITLAFLSNQHAVVYVPIDYAKRAGVSKFRFFSDAYRYILQVLRMVMYFNPLKVLMPVALFLLALGLLKGVYDMVVHPFYFAINTVLIFVTGLIIASLALLADLIVRSRGDT